MKTRWRYIIASVLVSLILYLGLFYTSPNNTRDEAEDAVLSATRRMRFSKTVRDIHLESGAILQVVPGVVHHGALVTVTWESIPNPSLSEPFDWVGLYCPIEAHGLAYLDYAFVYESPSYSRGRGSLRFKVYNLRTDCHFRYYRNDTLMTLLAVSNTLYFSGGETEPLQGHLALTGNPTEMRVGWVSGTSDTPTVKYGPTLKNMSLSASGISKTYKRSDLCGPPANTSALFVNPGFLHDVLLTNLTPKTTYYYKFGSRGNYSDVRSFTAAAGAGDPTPFKFIMYGDMGTDAHPGGETTAKRVLDEVINGAAFVIHQGDLSYATGRAVTWDKWMTLIEPYATLVPYMISIGNHEYDYLEGGKRDPSGAEGVGFHPKWGNYGYDSGGECGVPSYYRFHMPDNGNSVFWYSFNFGLIHFTVISTEHDFTPGSRMYRWIKKDLKSVDRKLTPWIIFVGHRAMYFTEKYPSEYEIMNEMQKSLEGLFYQQRVDLAVWGHYHCYERTCAVYNGVCDPKGTVHVVAGSAGYELDNAATNDYPWSIHFEKSYGYLRVELANASALHLEYIRNIDGTVGDSVWLKKT